MKTVLVVDDSPAELKLMCLYLKEAGYLVISTDDAKEAVEKAETQKPDLVAYSHFPRHPLGGQPRRSNGSNFATPVEVIFAGPMAINFATPVVITSLDKWQ